MTHISIEKYLGIASVKFRRWSALCKDRDERPFRTPNEETQMKVKEIMSKDVASVMLNTTLREAAETMKSKDVGVLAVTT